MTAYVVVDMDVTDPEAYEEYKSAAARSVAQYEGKYIVRGGRWESLEGDWRPRRLVLLEFPSVDHAKRWFSSSEYAEARRLRRDAARAQMVVVEGL